VLLVGDVAVDALDVARPAIERGDGLFEPVGVGVEDDHLSTQLGQRLHEDATEQPGAAGDHRSAAGEGEQVGQGNRWLPGRLISHGDLRSGGEPTSRRGSPR
jgi:hypothetical protein